MTRISADDIIRPSSRLIELARAAQAGEDSLPDGAVGADGFGFVLVTQVESNACWRPWTGYLVNLPMVAGVRDDFVTVARALALTRGQMEITELIEELFDLGLIAVVPDGSIRLFGFYMGPSGLALGARSSEAYRSCPENLDELAAAWDGALRKVEPAALNWRARSDFGWHPIRIEGMTPTPPFSDDDAERVLLEAIQRHTPSDTRALLDVLIAWSALPEERQAAHRPRFEAVVRSGWEASLDAVDECLLRLEADADDTVARDTLERLYPLLASHHIPRDLPVTRERWAAMSRRHREHMQRWWPAACWPSAPEDLA